MAFGLCYASESVDIEPLKVSHVTTVVSVGVTATALPTTPLVDRRVIMVQNISANTIYLGNAAVTSDEASTGGFQLLATGDVWVGDFGDSIIVYAISVAGSDKCVVWECR